MLLLVVTQPKKLYTRGEEIFNAVSHIAGGAFAVVAGLIGIYFAAIHNDTYAVVAMCIYGVCMIIAYTASSIYHFLRPGRAKKVFQIFDHCSIFLLIVGTYTPFCLILLRNVGAWGWGLLGGLWLLAIIGITLKGIFLHNRFVRRLGMVIYLAMGWCALIAIVPILEVLHPVGLWLTLAGGIAYTVGAVFFGFGGRVRYIHSVWHLFVLTGTVLQYFAILFYVVIV